MTEPGISALDAGIMLMKLTGTAVKDERNGLLNNSKPTLKDMLLKDPHALTEYLSKRLQLERGEFVFELGWESECKSMELNPTELKLSLTNLSLCAKSLNADATILHETSKETFMSSSETSSINPDNKHNMFAHILIRSKPRKVEEIPEIRVYVAGNVDSGKSTMLETTFCMLLKLDQN